MSGKLQMQLVEEDNNQKGVNCITRSKMAKYVHNRAYQINHSIPKEDLLIIMGLQWSNDCDLNSSIKANRRSIWVKAMTIISQNFHDNGYNDTYPMYIGKQ